MKRDLKAVAQDDATTSSESENSTAVESSFETAIQNLESIVQSLEEGDCTLDESLKAFEKAIALSRYCTQKLEAAEHRIRILTSEGLQDADATFFPESANSVNPLP